MSADAKQDVLELARAACGWQRALGHQVGERAEAAGRVPPLIGRP